MESSDRLKVIGRTGIGYDSVDVEATTKLGIPVVITPGANNRGAAEHAVTCMLAQHKNMVEPIRNSAGTTGKSVMLRAFEAEGKTCLIVSLGTIGKIIAHLCAGLDMKVIHSGVRSRWPGWALRAADVVIVQTPLIEGVINHTIAKAELDAMKPAAVLIFLGTQHTTSAGESRAKS